MSTNNVASSDLGSNFFTLNGNIPGEYIAFTDNNLYPFVVRGTSIPANGTAGYSIGCYYVLSTGNGAGSTVYINEGSITSSLFNPLNVSGGGSGGGLSIPFTETDSITTTGTSVGDSATALTTGSVFKGTVATGVFTTGGSVFNAAMNAVTAGNGFVATTTGVYTGTGISLLTANSATTGVINVVSATGLTTGSAFSGTVGTALTTGAVFNAAMGAATAGAALKVATTGVYTDTTTGLLPITANSLTTGYGIIISMTGATSGQAIRVIGGGANITSGSIMTSFDMGAATTGAGIKITSSGAYTGVAGAGNGLLNVTANSATSTGGVIQTTATALTSGTLLLLTGGGANVTTTGKVADFQLGAATTGIALNLSTTGAYTGDNTNGLLRVVANSATTTAGLIQVSGTALTSGSAVLVTGGGANLGSGGKVIEVAMGAATTGNGLTVTSTGVYTAAAGNALVNVVANSATTPQGGLVQISGTALTTGVVLKSIATAATLTTGFYYAANDSALNVLTIGANGHITSNQTTAPTIAVSTQNGITAAAITAASSDVAGTITTTGTNNNGGNTVLTVTFNKTYTTAPKVVQLQEVNNSAAIAQTFVTTTATTFVLNIVASALSGATPSWTYLVMA